MGNRCRNSVKQPITRRAGDCSPQFKDFERKVMTNLDKGYFCQIVRLVKAMASPLSCMIARLWSWALNRCFGTAGWELLSLRVWTARRSNSSIRWRKSFWLFERNDVSWNSITLNIEKTPDAGKDAKVERNWWEMAGWHTDPMDVSLSAPLRGGSACRRFM